MGTASAVPFCIFQIGNEAEIFRAQF